MTSPRSGCVRWTLRSLVALGLLVAASSQATEGLLNRLLAPGPLIQGHAKLESDCLKCHDMGKGVPGAKCMDCHKDVGASVRSKSGFHGLQTRACSECHAEHKGRTFDSSPVDTKAFDHKLTGFVLDGKHQSIDCLKCHTGKKGANSIHPGETQWIGKKTSCVACHVKDDIHFFKGDWAKKDCNTCHGTFAWKKDLKFSHEKDAHYPLLGKHAELKCQDCHNPQKENRKESNYHWKGLKTASCLACHEEIHRHQMSAKFSGPKCETCHSQAGWKIPSFAHKKVTGYALAGAHLTLKCYQCHTQTPSAIAAGPKKIHWMGLRSQCASCHEDPHKNHLSSKFKGQCETCHSNQTWKIAKFDHQRVTQFALRGKHAEIDCAQCHVQPKSVMAKKETEGRKQYHWIGLKSACLDCHQDTHRFGAWRSAKFKHPNQCLECHEEKSWKPTHFSHTEDTRYAIDGKHLGLKCDACHLEKSKKPPRTVYHWDQLKKKNCELCHANPHVRSPNKQFNLKRCDECHLTVGWFTLANSKSFDHDASRFPLTGKHTALKCKDCHESGGKQIFRWETADKKFCVSCHTSVHQGQFSSNFSNKSCAECHSTRNFSERLPFNHETTAFHLQFKHQDLKCDKCHIPTGKTLPLTKDLVSAVRAHKFLFPDLGAKNCATCHKDSHRGNFGTACAECHREDSWKKTKDFHQNFSLTGIHYSLDCAECHKQSRKLAGMSQNCVACHQKDDIHNGTLPNCGECHKQQFWENAEFRHSLTQFPLRGIHRTLDCNNCHSRGTYRGTPVSCGGCHLRDAPTVTRGSTPAHIFPQMLNCNDCHNQFQF